MRFWWFFLKKAVADWWRSVQEADARAAAQRTEVAAQRTQAQRQKRNKKEEVDVPTADPTGAAVWEHTYVKAHPCLCGGAWRMLTHDSPIPSGTSGMVCECTKCGGRKVFVFKLW
jgi:hypothetical protein